MSLPIGSPPPTILLVGAKQEVPNLPPPLSVSTTDDMTTRMRNRVHILTTNQDAAPMPPSLLVTSPVDMTVVSEKYGHSHVARQMRESRGQHPEKEEPPRVVSKAYEEFGIKGDRYTWWG
ncbi:hypothetical protein NE237_027025 [Protea cynaroides]|uniref:Uncharacterized protein n=1 Tax=Protea cynaroides TaxID=273540 RepID=A0A9Q0JU12_9MAGN|nr:hypothetical protein NE237_027025 [Protea cynaroides]